MTSEYATLDQTTTDVTFWLSDWDVIEISPAVRLRSRHLLCQIDRNQVAVEDSQRSLIIPVERIVKAERVRFYQGLSAGFATNLKITLSDEYRIKKGRLNVNWVHMLPIDPLTHRVSKDEIDIMVDVINSFRQGTRPDQADNPYHRAFKRQNREDSFSESEWNARLHPGQAAIQSGLRKRAIITILAFFPVTILAMFILWLFLRIMGFT